MNKDYHYNVKESLMEAKIELEEAAKKLKNVVQSQENGKGETKKQLKVMEETLESAAGVEVSLFSLDHGFTFRCERYIFYKHVQNLFFFISLVINYSCRRC